MNSRLLSFGSSIIGLEYGDGRPAVLVDFLFQKIPGSEPEKPWTLLRLEDRGQNDGLWLWQDDKLVAKESLPGTMANHLMSQVCYTLAYESRGGLLVHSAAVQAANQGIILPGKSGAGKSTLTAWLITHGCRYLTDEMVYIGNSSKTMSGFTRPITIKLPARHMILEILKEDRTNDGMMHGEAVDMISPELFGAEVVKGDASLDLIVFPQYQADHKIEMRQLSKAQAAFELMKCLANARNLPQHGLPEVVRLAESTPAYQLNYNNLDEAGQLIQLTVSNMSTNGE
jgi:hypothetical protein